jgi:predicted nucleic acid-binding protein
MVSTALLDGHVPSIVLAEVLRVLLGTAYKHNHLMLHSLNPIAHVHRGTLFFVAEPTHSTLCFSMLSKVSTPLLDGRVPSIVLAEALRVLLGTQMNIQYSSPAPFPQPI